jgi:hypothetical protein
MHTQPSEKKILMYEKATQNTFHFREESCLIYLHSPWMPERNQQGGFQVPRTD